MSRFFPVHDWKPEDIRDFDPQPFIDRNDWIFAKTMAEIPHWYVMRWNVRCEDSEEARAAADREFQFFVQHMRSRGMPRRWGRRMFVYLAVGEYEYWTMGDKLETTWTINRAKIDSPARFGPGR